MFPKLLIAGHLLCREIDEVWQSQGNQSFLLLGTLPGQTFLCMLELESATFNIKSFSEAVSLYLFLSGF